MIAIPVMLLSINSNDGENWWLKTVIRAAMVCSAVISLKLYIKSEAKQKHLAQQLTKAASAPKESGRQFF